MSEAPAIPRPPLPGPRAKGEPGRPLALWVDGDELLFGLAERRLGAHLELLQARNDRDACELLRARHGELSAVFCDVDLAGSVLDGILLTRVLRGKVPSAALPPFARGLPQLELPIFLVSEQPERHSEGELRRYGVSKLMAKPPSFLELALAMALHHLA